MMQCFRLRGKEFGWRWLIGKSHDQKAGGQILPTVPVAYCKEELGLQVEKKG